MTHEDMFKEFNYECLSEQVGGSHYKDLKVSPAYFIWLKTFRKKSSLPTLH